MIVLQKCKKDAENLVITTEKVNDGYRMTVDLDGIRQDDFTFEGNPEQAEEMYLKGFLKGRDTKKNVYHQETNLVASM